MENEHKNFINDMPDYSKRQAMIESAMEVIYKRKSEIVQEKLLSLNLNIPIERTRFPPLCWVIDDSKREFLFYNNQTKNGLFVVGFEIEFLDTQVRLVTINNYPPGLIL